MAYDAFTDATAIGGGNTSIDLTNVLKRFQILAPGSWVDAVSVLRIPVGAIAFIHFGQQGPIPLLMTAPFIGFSRVEDANMGVFISCPAQPGVTIDLFIAFGDAPAGQNTQPTPPAVKQL